MTRRLPVLAGAATLSMLLAGLMIFLYAPTDALEGDVQRIFYLHVSTAIGAYAAFSAVAVCGILYLWREGPVADRIAVAAAEVGLLFTTVTLVMGSLYGKAIWGTYWTWDARLTSTLVLWMMYAAYILVRRIATPGRQAARFAAVVGIIGALDIPIVHFSVNWWRTQHPQSVLTASGGPALPPEMLITFFLTMAATLFLGVVLVMVRYRLETMSQSVAVTLEERRAA